jgi:hypothetical protein
MFFVSAGVAHADPSFVLTESEARAGDTVHFSISGAEGRVTYDLEIEDREVVEDGAGSGRSVSGQFTMPDLGPSSRTITVKASIEDSDDSTTVTRKLQYLVPDQAVAGPAGALPPPAPAALQQAAANPEPAHPSLAAKPPASRRPAEKRRASRAPRRERARHTGRRQESAPSRGRSRRRAGPVKRARSKRVRPRTAPLFDGVPESASTPGSEAGPPIDGSGFLGLNAIAPPTAVLTAASASGPGGGGPTAAVLVPALLGLMALALVGTVLVRRRRLSTVQGQADDVRLAAFTRVARSGTYLQRGIARRSRARRHRRGE